MEYEIIDDGKAIKCLKCNMTSYHPKDVEHRWCGNCKCSLAGKKITIEEAEAMAMAGLLRPK